MKLNPFNIIIRTKTSPFSEILRHNFKAKIVDTFAVFFGRHRLAEGRVINLGILDWLSLGVLTLPSLLQNYCSTNTNLFTKIGAPFAAIFFGFTLFVRFVLSVIGALNLNVTIKDENHFKHVSLKDALETLETKTCITLDAALYEDAIGVGVRSDVCTVGASHGEDDMFSLPYERPIDEAQNKAFSALLRLNLFQYTRGLEEIKDPMRCLPTVEPLL